ncbi:fimb protein [Luteimonas padinae]|uniref:TfpX/TfpZ family type IV pilin accessory protein n=1 Tax=Luteimonas padinae TaxID=1714359 RepID=A0ABV6SUM4_9GAMM|nr:TfpX/TfpZ family type IV pilin accessory protein [Luteimonas padinae]GHD74254.1 fimb protein [Luteimonas padinae]
MTRYKAFAIHFVLSMLVAAVASGVLLGLWYPPPYFQAGGADTLLILLVGVDVVLGPLLTMIVFDQRKPELKRDLAVIVALQLSALAYGFHVMLQSRPVFLVAAVDRFVVVAANELEPDDLAEASQPRWRELSWTGPVLVAAALPHDAKQREELMSSALSGKDIEKFPRYFVDYEEAIPSLLERARPLSQLRAKQPTQARRIDVWLRRTKQSEDSVVWVPLVARSKDITMLMDKHTGMPLDALSVPPW